MKKGLWLVSLVVGCVLIAATAISIAVPIVQTMIAPQQSVAIIGGADGPTALFLTQRLFWELLRGRVWFVLVGVIFVTVAVILKITGKKNG